MPIGISFYTFQAMSYIFDVYKGEHVDASSKSLAYSLTFASSVKTLSYEEAMEAFNNILDKVKEKFGAKLRDK